MTMPNDESLVVHNSGSGAMNVHAPIVGGRGNSVVMQAASLPAASTGDVVRVLHEIRRTAEAATDLTRAFMTEILTATDEAERCLTSAEPSFDRAALLLFRTRTALEMLGPAAGSAPVLREMLACALQMLPT
jgi:hypothetical protein